MSTGQWDFHLKRQRKKKKKSTIHFLESISELQHIMILQSGYSEGNMCVFSEDIHYSTDRLSSPNWSYFELHSVNVKHFHLLQRNQEEKYVSNIFYLQAEMLSKSHLQGLYSTV